MARTARVWNAKYMHPPGCSKLHPVPLPPSIPPRPPRVLELPKWHGRAWQPVFDTSKVAPFDALIPDEELGEAEVKEVRAPAWAWRS